MFYVTTAYGISAIILGSIMAVFYDDAYNSSTKKERLNQMLSPTAIHLLMVTIMVILMMTPVLNTVLACKGVRKVFRRIKRKLKQ